MDKTGIKINLSPKMQGFLRFYYKCQKPFFEFPTDHSINAWLSDNLQEIPDNVSLNFGANTFKVEVPLLFGQDFNRSYHVNKAFTIMFQHRINNLLKDYYNKRFEESIAEKQGVDFTVINIMNELGIINLKSIIQMEQIEFTSENAFQTIKDIVLKNNRTEFDAISKRFTRWKGKEYVRNWREKSTKKSKKNIRVKCPAV